MFRIEPEDLAEALERTEEIPRITVEPEVIAGARLALDRMLALP
jgi:quinolinate synthase